MQIKPLLHSLSIALYGIICVLVLFIIVGAAIWWHSKPTEQLVSTFAGPIREQVQQYQFIKPLLMYEVGDKADYYQQKSDPRLCIYS